MSENQIIGAIAGAGIIAIIFICLIAIAAIVVFIIGEVKLFKKAGKPGWAAIVPFYNTYVLVEIAGLNWWWFLIAIAGSILTASDSDGFEFISFAASAFANFVIFFNLAKKFHQEPKKFAILGLFFSPIMITILGLSNSYEYDSSAKVSLNGPFGEEKENNSTTEPEKFCLGCGKKLKPDAKFCENCGKEVK